MIKLITCFYDTVKISHTRLKSYTEKAVMSSKVYMEGFQHNLISSKIGKIPYKSKIVVEENTTFSAAKKYYSEGKVAVLNFANPHTPGGGVKSGAMAQEECLCRSSNLYLCLEAPQVYNDFYKYHKKQSNNMFSDRIIYTDAVTVFKTDEKIPQIMEEKDWYHVGVLTCAAPYNIRSGKNENVLLNIFKNRVKNIFEVALDNNVEVLILGAFGCGAFNNQPEIVAKAFREVIKENNYELQFKRIVFAIKSTVNSKSKRVCPNISAFEKEFGKEEHNVVVDANVVNRNTRLEKNQISYKSHYRNKQFSILGDSISTLEGFNPQGYKCFYAGDNCKKSGVLEMKDTWWGKVIDFLGGELLVNNSWSGSRVTKLPSSEKIFPSGCSDERTSSLHMDRIQPDVIIVYLGTNDWAFGAKARNDTRLMTEDAYEIFELAYDKMLKKLKCNYPNSQIWCCTLCETYISSHPNFQFPHEHAGIHIEVYNRIIREAVQSNGCRLIDLYEYHIPYDSLDGSHPNESGMKTLAAMVIRSVAGMEAETFLDCANDGHTYKAIEEHTGWTRYICTKCGREKRESLMPPESAFRIPFPAGSSNAVNKNRLQFEDMSYPNQDITEILSLGGNYNKVTKKTAPIAEVKQSAKLLGALIDGKYRVHTKIGESTYSTIYLVLNERENTFWVMKVCDKKLIQNSAYMYEYATQKALIMANLEHHAIPRIVDIIDDDSCTFIIREYVEGRSLQEILKEQGAQPPDLVIEWGKQLCGVLKYLHGLIPPRIYCDMKPANVILTPDGCVKLIDFNTMKILDRTKAQDMNIILGTKGYAPPEQYGGLMDERSDIYALGVTMHYLATGINPSEPPYKLRPIREWNPKLPKELEAIIIKCTQVNPDERYQNCEELLDALEGRKIIKRNGFLKKIFGV